MTTQATPTDGAAPPPSATNALVVEGVRKTFEAENAPVRALRGVDLTVRSRGVRRAHGPVGLRQVDAAQPRRGPRRGRRGDDHRRRRARHGPLRGRARADAPPAHRHRVPVLQPARGDDGARERGAAVDHRGAPPQGRRDEGPRPPRPPRHRRQGVVDARRALRRPAPAPRHRPRARERADAALGRRADRRARLRRRPGGRRAARAACTPAARRSCSSRTTPRSRRRRPPSCTCATAAS